MKLQRILAKDSRSANEQAIAKYGRDVLVVSNNRVNGMTELIVAVDVEPDKMPPPVIPRGAGEPFESALRQQLQSPKEQSPSPAGTAASIAEPAIMGDAFVPAQMALMQAAQRAAAQSLGQSEPLRPAATASTAAPFPTKAAAGAAALTSAKGLHYGQQFSLRAHTAAESAPFPLSQLTVSSVLDGRATVIGSDPHAEAADASVLAHATETTSDCAVDAATTSIVNKDKAHALTDLIRAEISQLRKEMRMGQQLQAWAAQGPAYRWNEALAEVGVPTMLRALLMSGLSNDFDDAQALAAIAQQMSENLPSLKAQRGRRPNAAAWAAGVHLLSGPSGSGKTSMAAKLAHEASQRLGVDQVILVSWADNRPGAWGQLQLWAARIGVNAFRAADSATLDLLLQEHRGSLIIVDSGLSQPDILIAAVQGLQAQHHLVMSADANAATLRRWVGGQAPAWTDVLITRLDESAQPWPLLQACCEHQLRPAMASDGSGLNHLRMPYDAAALLQHAMGVLGQTLCGGAEGAPVIGRAGPSLDIPTIDQITTTVPPRQAGRSGRSRTAAKPASAAVAAASSSRTASASRTKNSAVRGRHGAPHA
jgi:flagellar biosynthesis GTPase FlhF